MTFAEAWRKFCGAESDLERIAWSLIIEEIILEGRP